MGAIKLARVYDRDPRPPGKSFFVERLWPRGVRREDLPEHSWRKDVAPSTELRQWFGHDPAKWLEFCSRYAGELDARPEAWRPLIDALAEGDVILLYSSRDRDTTTQSRYGATCSPRAGASPTTAEVCLRHEVADLAHSDPGRRTCPIC